MTLKTFLQNTANKLANMGPGQSPYSTKEALKAGTKDALIATGFGLGASSGTIKTGTQIAKTIATPVVSSLGKSYATSFATAPIKTVAYTAGASYGGLVVAKSSKAKEAISNLPRTVDTSTTNVAKYIDNPSKENFEPLIPVVTGAGILGGLLLAKKTGGALTSLINTGAIREQTQALKEQTELLSQPLNTPQIEYKNVPTSQQSPPLSSTNTGGVPDTPLVSYGSKETTTYKKTKKKAKTLYSSPVRITNRIMVLNKNG